MNPTIPFIPESVAVPASPRIDETARRASDEAWPRANQRRLDLIDKRHFGGGLTPEETAELESLQAAADRRAAPQDRQLVAKAEEILRRARGTSNAPAS